jgi:hypothetical protein
MGLQSSLFRGDPRLEAAAVSNPAHILRGASGPHVQKIQTALILLDRATISDDELFRAFFGDSTANAVLSYKQKRNIINRTYQTRADNIVGKMTMASLDSEMKKIPQPAPVRIRPLSFHRTSRPTPPSISELGLSPPHLRLNFGIGTNQILAAGATRPQLNTSILELRRNGVGRFEVANGISGTVQVIEPDIAKIRSQSRKVGTFFAIKKDPEPFDLVGGKILGKTLVMAIANGFSASLEVVVKPFGGPPPFHPGVHHDHTPCRKWETILHHPDNGSGSDKDRLDKACQVLATAADAPVPLPHGPELLVAVARTIAVFSSPLASRHLEFYLHGGGKDFVEDAIIKDWITRDSGIRKRLKKEIFGRRQLEGHFKFEQSDYAKDDAGQDFRFAFGGIDRVDYEVDLADHLVRVWFQDRYEWHPFYPKLYPLKSGDVKRDTNCVHAAMVEMQDQGAADYWMKGVAEVPLSLIKGP